MDLEKSLKRGAGILLPISSLPSPYGIGTMGQEAYHFVDLLEEAGQSYWQVLPIGPTSYGDSPYQSFSAFAGNPYFIDLDILCREKLLTKKLIESYTWMDDDRADRVSYEKLWESRYQVLQIAYENSKTVFDEEEKAEKKQFEKENRSWLEDYALFMSLKAHYGQKEWLKWDEDIRFRRPEAMKKYRSLLKDSIDFWKFIQYEFYKQWSKLKQYANSKKIRIIGDIPIYVALDSTDVWSKPELFQLDENLNPKRVAGCPPDAFSDEGQKWGNPLYDWDRIEKDGFRWWKKRIAGSAKLYDVIRIDHFIGVVRYYSIPAQESAKNGDFVWGPGEKLVKAIDQAKKDADIIAEDLGVVIPEVRTLLKKSGYPGMKVIEFAYDRNPDNEHLPQNYSHNYVVYGGTHDNDTLLSYYGSLREEERQYAYDYLGVKGIDHMLDATMRLAYQSVADTVIWQMQDILKKDGSARMNLPATIGENWRWRLTKGEFGRKHAKKLAHLVDVYGRNKARNE